MFNFKLDKSEYYDFVLTNDEKTYNRNYSDFELFFIDVTEGLFSLTGIKLTEDATLNNISLTGYDNFFIPFGNGTIDPSIKYQFSIGDSFLFHQVSGYTGNYEYKIINNSDFNQLNGGFYQGSFKYHGLPIEFLPSRFRRGWTFDMLVKTPVLENSGKILNNTNPNNSGFIMYFGTRAENKFLNKTEIEINKLDELYGIKIKDIDTEFSDGFYELDNQPYVGYFNITNGIPYTGRVYDSESKKLTILNDYSDLINNAFGVRITPDGRIGYRTIYSNDPCYTGELIGISDLIESDNVSTYFSDFTNDCDDFTINRIYTKHFIIEESYTKTPIIDINGSEPLNICVVFNRDVLINGDKCSLKYIDYINGTLSIYINGFMVYSNSNFKEVIPNQLNEMKELQEGVPFNISFGGGTQGLLESIYLDGTKQTTGIIDKLFTGSFLGSVKSIGMYSVPLYVTEIRDLISKKYNNHNLYQIKGGRRIFIKNKF